MKPKKRRHAGEICIRDARKTDIPALLEIYNQVVLRSPATFDLDSQTLGHRRKWFSEHGRRHPIIVAESQGRVIGYASLSRFRDKPAYSMSVEDSIYVRSGFQGKGVGKLLMKETVARAIKLGYHTLIAGVVPPNEASVKLHEGLGFVHVGSFKEVGFKFSHWQDVTFYQLMLSAKPAINNGPPIKVSDENSKRRSGIGNLN